MDVKVRAEEVGGIVQWTIDGRKPKESEIHLPPRSGKHTLDFHLDDRTSKGLRFAPDAIWVHENETGVCPPEGVASNQISIASIKPKKLSIIDENKGAPCTLQYQLNFEDNAGVRFDVDPVIRNGGGTL